MYKLYLIILALIIVALLANNIRLSKQIDFSTDYIQTLKNNLKICEENVSKLETDRFNQFSKITNLKNELNRCKVTNAAFEWSYNQLLIQSRR